MAVRSPQPELMRLQALALGCGLPPDHWEAVSAFRKGLAMKVWSFAWRAVLGFRGRSQHLALRVAQLGGKFAGLRDLSVVAAAFSPLRIRRRAGDAP